MKTVRNTTRLPLRISLAGGKVLRLGPGKTGQIQNAEADRKSVLDLLAKKSIEIVDDESQGGFSRQKGSGGKQSSQGHHRSTKASASGDR